MVQQITGIKSPFEISDSMEEFEVKMANQGGYDDILSFNQAVNSYFERADIDVTTDLPKETTQSTTFMGW